MKTRTYGSRPPTIVAVHGGPGAAGEIAPLAEELAARGHSVLEPMQSAKTVDGQTEELFYDIQKKCEEPVIVIGWSWGAWLGCLLAAKHPAKVRALILIGCPPFEAHLAENISSTRLSRLNEEELSDYNRLFNEFDKPENTTQLLEMFDKTDGYATNNTPHPSVEIDLSIHESVWQEAAEMRLSGELLERVRAIQCPVFALHGDCDPHPALGASEPLEAIIEKFEFCLLEKCGHKPWRETYAMETFFQELEQAIQLSNSFH